MYNPYGEVARPEGNGGTNGGGRRGGAGEVLYAGYRTDPEMGLHQVRFGFYHPTLGRWVARDAQLYGDSMSMYQYVTSAPVSALDPSGRLSMTFTGQGMQAGTLEPSVAPRSGGPQLNDTFGAYCGINVKENRPGEMGAGLLSHRIYEYELWKYDAKNKQSKTDLKKGKGEAWFWDRAVAQKQGAQTYHSIVNLRADAVLANMQFDPETRDVPSGVEDQQGCPTSGWIKVQWEAMSMNYVPEEYGGPSSMTGIPDPAFWDEHAHKPSLNARPKAVYGPMQFSIEIELRWENDVVTKFETRQSHDIAVGSQRPGHRALTDVYVPGPPNENGVRVLRRTS